MTAGRLWKARDRLDGALQAAPHDPEILELLGETCFAMGDLPRAGAAWFLTERTGEDVDAARAAFRERHGGRDAELLRALPFRPPLSAYPELVRERLIALGVPPDQQSAAVSAPAAPLGRWQRVTAALVVLLIIAIVVLVLATFVVGLADVLGSTDASMHGRVSPAGLIGTAVLTLISLGFLALPFIGVRSLRSRRRQATERAQALGSGPSIVSDRRGALLPGPTPGGLLGLGLFGLVFPLVAPFALLYTIDHLRLIRLSAGRIGGRAQARIAFALGAIGTLELIVLAVILAAWPVR